MGKYPGTTISCELEGSYQMTKREMKIEAAKETAKTVLIVFMTLVMFFAVIVTFSYFFGAFIGFLIVAIGSFSVVMTIYTYEDELKRIKRNQR